MIRRKGGGGRPEQKGNCNHAQCSWDSNGTTTVTFSHSCCCRYTVFSPYVFNVVDGMHFSGLSFHLPDFRCTGTFDKQDAGWMPRDRNGGETMMMMIPAYDTHIINNSWCDLLTRGEHSYYRVSTSQSFNHVTRSTSFYYLDKFVSIAN